MRRGFVVLVPCLLLAACSNRSISEDCPNATTTPSGQFCVVTAQCVGTNTGVKLDCDTGSAFCTCYENDIVGTSIPFDDAYCIKSADDVIASVNDACGWKL